MRHLENLKEMLCTEIGEYSKKTKLSSTDLEALYKMTDIVKDLDKILHEEGGYSHDGMWEARMNGVYGRGESYARHRNARGEFTSRGKMDDGYSYGDSKEDMIEHLEDMMRDSDNDRVKNIIKRCADSLKNI